MQRSYGGEILPAIDYRTDGVTPRMTNKFSRIRNQDNLARVTGKHRIDAVEHRLYAELLDGFGLDFDETRDLRVAFQNAADILSEAMGSPRKRSPKRPGS